MNPGHAQPPGRYYLYPEALPEARLGGVHPGDATQRLVHRKRTSHR